MKVTPLRQDGNQRERNLLRPWLVSDLHYSQRKTVPEKALTISGADRFSRRGGTCRLHAIFMNQLSINWGFQDELSSPAVCPRAEGIIQSTIQAARGALLFRHVCNPLKPVNSSGVEPKNRFRKMLRRKLSRCGRVSIFWWIEIWHRSESIKGACQFARTPEVPGSSGETGRPSGIRLQGARSSSLSIDSRARGRQRDPLGPPQTIIENKATANQSPLLRLCL